MKLRVLDDSIRLRLSQSEVTEVDRKGSVEGRTAFPGGESFAYVLVSSASAKSAAAEFSDGRITVTLPSEEVSSWANDETTVSLTGSVQLPEGNELTILVEKDFHCLVERPGEDQSDLFVNPNA